MIDKIVKPFCDGITNLPWKFANCKFEPNALIALAVIGIYNSILRPHYGFVHHVRLSVHINEKIILKKYKIILFSIANKKLSYSILHIYLRDMWKESFRFKCSNIIVMDLDLDEALRECSYTCIKNNIQ